MSARRLPTMQPTPEWRPRPFFVLLEDRDDPGPRLTVRIANAIGSNDARNQARELHPDMLALRAWEAES